MYKYTVIWQVLSSDGGAAEPSRLGGWSESYYTNNLYDPTNPGSPLNTLIFARSILLGSNCSAIAVRTQQVDPVGPARLYAINVPGTGTWGQSDYPAVSLQLHMQLNGGATGANLYLRGVPDQQVTGGLLVPVGAYMAYVRDYISQLISNGCNANGTDFDTFSSDVFSITDIAGGKGQITAMTPLVYAAGQVIQILRTVEASSGRRRGGKFVVDAAYTGLEPVIRAWPYGDTRGGGLRFIGNAWRPYISGQFVRLTSRKVGRPFDPYRGRRSSR